MKLVVFGSTGATGRHLVDQALDTDHGVTAFARQPDRLDGFAHADLSVLRGDVLSMDRSSGHVEGSSPSVRAGRA